MTATIMMGIILMGGGVFASTLGNLHVIAPPGIEVYVDGDHMGTTSASDGGLLIRGVTADEEHALSAEKNGETIFHKEFTVETNRTTTMTIQAPLPGGRQK
jgi:helix-turn-helix protein